MTDCNDGKWHGHEGVDCPVHPESEVELVEDCMGVSKSYGKAGSLCPSWERVIAFRVTKPYVEPPKPREVWVCFDEVGSARGARDTKDGLSIFGHKDRRLFREVLP